MSTRLDTPPAPVRPHRARRCPRGPHPRTLLLAAIVMTSAGDVEPALAATPQPPPAATSTGASAPGQAAPAAAPPSRAEPPAGDTAQALFEAGNARYVKGQYEAAARLYARALREHHVDDPHLYANLGDAYFRLGQWGSAIFCYRRALRLHPPDDAAARIRANLETTRRLLQKRYRASGTKSQFIYTEPGGFLYALTHVLPGGWLATLFLVLWTLALGALVWRRLRPGGKAPAAVALGAGLAATLFGLLLWGQVYADRSFRLGVIVQDEVVLHEGRHRDARGVDIPEGMEVRVLEADEAWARVELANGREGWVPTESVKEI